MSTWQILRILLIPTSGDAFVIMLMTIGLIATSMIWEDFALFCIGVVGYALFLMRNAYESMR